MRIDRTSWHYKLQAKWSEMETNSFCEYFRRMILVKFSESTWMLTTVVVSVFMNVILFTISPLFGWIPVSLFPLCVNNEKNRVRYRKRAYCPADYHLNLWCKPFYLFRIFGHEVKPFHLLALLGGVWLLSAFSYLVFVLVVVVCFFAIAGLPYPESGLVKTWLKSRKDGVCPLIEYTGEKPQAPLDPEVTEF